MAKNKTGFTQETKKHLLLGAGAIFKDFEVGVDTYESSKSKIVAATQGGNEFKAVPAVRPIQIDGIKGKAKGLDVIDSWDVSLTVTFIEASKDVILAALGSAKQDTSDTTYDKISGDTEFKSSDYFKNITFIGTLAGTTKPVIIQIKNAVHTGGLTVKCQDDAEGVIQVVFEGRYEIGEEDNVPFDIYYPKFLKVSSFSVSVAESGTTTVEVSNAIGTVTVSSADTSVATAVISTNTVTITGVDAGETTVTISDSEGNKVDVAVAVTE